MVASKTIGVGEFSPGSVGSPLPLGSGSLPLCDRSEAEPPDVPVPVAVAKLKYFRLMPGVTLTVTLTDAVPPIVSVSFPLSSRVSEMPLYPGLTVRPDAVWVPGTTEKVSAPPNTSARSSRTWTLFKLTFP